MSVAVVDLQAWRSPTLQKIASSPFRAPTDALINNDVADYLRRLKNAKLNDCERKGDNEHASLCAEHNQERRGSETDCAHTTSIKEELGIGERKREGKRVSECQYRRGGHDLRLAHLLRHPFERGIHQISTYLYR